MELQIMVWLSYKPATCWYMPKYWLPPLFIVLHSRLILKASRGSTTITDQITSLSTQRQTYHPTSPHLIASCYLPPSSSNGALFSIDETDLGKSPIVLSRRLSVWIVQPRQTHLIGSSVASVPIWHLSNGEPGCSHQSAFRNLKLNWEWHWEH